MIHRSRTRRFSSWLALAVFALNAFWPLLSLANPANSQALMEICSSTGMKQAPSDDGHSGIQIPQCPLCVVGGSMSMATPPAVALLALAVTQEHRPFAATSPAARAAAFFPAQPRAPPALS